MADLEGLRETTEAIVYSILPDVCYAIHPKWGPPEAPTPYFIMAYLNPADAVASTVKMKHAHAFTLVSSLPHVIGDEAAEGTGVVSGNRQGPCVPINSSTTVFAEGQLVVHHTALFYMNCDTNGRGNTVGKAVFLEYEDVSERAGLGWWGSLSAAVKARLLDIARKFNVNVYDLLAVIAQETNATFSPQTREVGGAGGIGLLQWTEGTTNMLRGWLLEGTFLGTNPAFNDFASLRHRAENDRYLATEAAAAEWDAANNPQGAELTPEQRQARDDYIIANWRRHYEAGWDEYLLGMDQLEQLDFVEYTLYFNLFVINLVATFDARQQAEPRQDDYWFYHENTRWFYEEPTLENLYKLVNPDWTYDPSKIDPWNRLGQIVDADRAAFGLAQTNQRIGTTIGSMEGITATSVTAAMDAVVAGATSPPGVKVTR